MTNTVLDSDRSACSSRPLSFCFHRRQRLRRPPSRPPTTSNQASVGTENPVRYLHPLQGYDHTPAGTEHPVRYLHPLQGYNHTSVGTENPVRCLHPLQGYNHSPRKDRPTSRRAYSTSGYNNKKQNGQQPNQPHGVHLNTAGRLSKGWGPPLASVGPWWGVLLSDESIGLVFRAHPVKFEQTGPRGVGQME